MDAGWNLTAVDSHRDGLRARRAALVIAHPGHELRVHGWLELARPAVFVLTDGSGSAGRSRLASTSRVLEAAGATPGTIYGRFTDRAVYDAMLAGDRAPFVALVGELADALCDGGFDYVAGDALEGYNPTHDVCRVLTDTAVRRGIRRGHAITAFDFPLVGRPDACPAARRRHAVAVALDPAAFDRKLAAARSYRELERELALALATDDVEAFRTELLRPVRLRGAAHRPQDVPPAYESYGERQAQAGRYARVLRYAEHFRPLARALRRHADA